MPISDLPVSVHASPGLPAFRNWTSQGKKTAGYTRHGQIQTDGRPGGAAAAQQLVIALHPTIRELLRCSRDSQDPCRHSCHASPSMICSGQRTAAEGRRGVPLLACSSRQVLMQRKALVRAKNNLHGGILKTLPVVRFNDRKKEKNRERLLYGARGDVWKSLSMPFLSHQTSILQLFLVLTILPFLSLLAWALPKSNLYIHWR